MTTQPFSGQVRVEWYQTMEGVSFTFYVKNRLETDVVVNATTSSLDVAIKLDADGREYNYSIDPFFGALSDSAPTVSVRAMKVEVSVKKASPAHWPTLEGVSGGGEVLAAAAPVPPAVVAGLPQTAKDLKYPNSRGKDWNLVKLDDEDEKPEGEAALNKVFQQIYGNGSDEQRRAMIKSFTESGGTVLSTNWEDVGKKKVDVQPPKGMEAKKMED